MTARFFLQAAVIYFLISVSLAQSTEDLSAACAQGINEQTCNIISSQISSAVSAIPGASASCVWTGDACILNLFIPNSTANHDTTATSISAACAKGNTAEEICYNISNMMNSAGQTPAGVTISCVWNNPGATNKCSERVVLNTNVLTSEMVGGLIKSITFIQAGSPTTNLIVRSDPFIPYDIHTVVDGTGFPTAGDIDVWMHVTAVADVTPTQYDFASIDPEELMSQEKAKIEAKFASEGTIEMGDGIGPDFTALKQVQTFTWNMSIPYDVNKASQLVGVANCNGTFNETIDQCQDKTGNPADWISLPKCTTPPSCAEGTYALDYPATGYLTIYGADPLPIYKTTTMASCTLKGDTPPCGSISVSEIIALISKWALGQASISEIIQLINAWAAGI